MRAETDNPKQRSTPKLESAMLATSCAVLVTDFTLPDNPIVFVNSAFTALTGYSPREAIGRNCRFLQGAETDRGVAAEIRQALAAGQPIRREILNYRKDGEAFWNDLMIDPIQDEDGKLTGFVGVQYRTTAGQAARSGLVEAEARLENIIGNLPGYIFRRILRPDGIIESPYYASFIQNLLGLSASPNPDEFYSHLHPDDSKRYFYAFTRSAADLSPFNEDFRLISALGDTHWFRSVASPRRLLNGDIVWDGVSLEITAEKAAETQLAFLASHDPLTGLANRTRFAESLQKAVVERSPGEQRACVFFIDLDDFQDVNDSFGQLAGDHVLQEVGSRLMKLAAPFDGIAARLGGDEFAILLPTINPAHIADLAKSICRDASLPIQISGHEITVQVCVGVAVSNEAHEATSAIAVDASNEIMQQADVALHAAKQEGPGSHRAYAVEDDDRARNRMALRQSLHRAIDEKQFQLHYQPLVELATGRIVGAEALVRWYHPTLGLQRPDLFIPLAESSGLILPLGAWILAEAMRQAQIWKRQGFSVPRIAINVSSVQLRKPGFLDTVKKALADSGANPYDFELELTEGLLIEGTADILSTLRAVKSLGFSLAIDDFGTGHSTFKYLRDFPADKIKIDQTFIQKLVVDSSDAVIVRSMIALAQSLHIDIVAEGVETTMQRDFLRDEGCKVGQGYLFSMPLTAEDFGWMLKNNLKLPTGEKTAAI